MKKAKINLTHLSVQSFQTSSEKDVVKGGSTIQLSLCICSIESLCNVCQGTEEGTVCCPPIK